MTKRLLRYLAPFALMLGLFVTLHRTASLQPATDGICPSLVQEALQELETNCSGLGRNIACYGYNRIGATFTQEVEEGYFSRPADRADLVTLQSISTAPMDTVNNEWGVALLNAQANLPGTLPGQSVTFILLGDATIVNAVPANEAALPVDPITVTAAVHTPLRSFATSASNTLVVVPAGAALAADAVSQDGLWTRVVYEQSGGWVRIDALASADLSSLPVVTDETYTPMQAFVFRTGIQQPTCSEAPNSVVIQGPTNTQVNLNVNGADIVVGSTVAMSSVQGAPSDIVDNLDLPDEIEDQLNGGSGGSSPDEQECALMQLSVVSGEALLNEGEFVLPEGNAAWSVYCGEPDETLPNDLDQEATDEPGEEQPPQNVGFASNWGAFRTLNQEELQQLGVLENLPPQVLNYEIEVPEEDEIIPAYQNTPTATATFIAPVFVPTSTSPPTLTPTLEPTFTPTNPPPPPPTARPGEGIPAAITASAGTPQSAMVGTAFTVGLQARVTDVYGSGVPNVNVTFAAPSSGASGSFDGPMTVTTNALGYANAPAFMANTIAGSYAVTATIDTFTATFDLANTPGAPVSIIAFAGTPQSTQVASAFAAPLQARILDQYSNGVPGVSVSFTAPASGASGSFASTGTSTETIVTDGLGIATTSVFTANTAVGSYVVTAAANILSVGFNLTNTSGSPASITPTAGTPQSTLIGTTFASSLQALVLDTYSDPVSGASVTFTAPASGASGTFGGSSTVLTDASGLATAPAFTANAAAGSYVVTATVGTLMVNFDLTNTNPVPSTSGLSQSSATAGDAAFTLTINGAGFASGAVVTWSGQADLIPTSNTGTAITVDVPADYLLTPGSFSVGVTNPAPGGGASNAQTFTVNVGTVVTSLNDSGPGSLRDIVAAVPAGSTITFAVALPNTITLSSPITIDKNLTIQGPGAGSLTVSGGGSTREFNLIGAINVTLAGLHLDAGGGGANGGTILSNGVTLTLNNVWISNSTGSGIYSTDSGGSVTILNSTFSGNHDTVDMGGAFHANTSFMVVNSTFQGNYGTWGAFSARKGTITVINSTFADNIGSIGGIENQAVFGSSVVLTNVILHNTACGGTFTEGTGNLVSTGTCTGITPAATGDPLLQTLGFNGGGTPTMALGVGSPALNAGNAGICTSAPVNSLDQRGVGRGNPCDIGAYEG